MKFNSVKKEYLPDPIKRHGDKPLIIGKNSDSEIVNEIINQINNRDQKYYELLKCKMEVNLITENNSYNGGVCIFPACLTKGLEFDMVIIAGCDNKSYRNNQLERNLLYVQSTRAMHDLVIMYSGTMSPLLLKIGKEFYSEMETDQEKAIKIRAAKDSLMMLLNIKFGGINEQVEEIIKEELDYDRIQKYIAKAAMENDLSKIFEIKNIVDESQNTEHPEVSEETERTKEKKTKIQIKQTEKQKEIKNDDIFSKLIDDLVNDHIVDEANKNIQYPFTAYSWTVKSPETALKRMDKSVYKYDETGIPMEVTDYFEIKNLKIGRKVNITIYDNNFTYNAYLEKDLINRAKLRWDNTFRTVISNIIETEAEKFKVDNLFMRFKKISKYSYQVDFL